MELKNVPTAAWWTIGVAFVSTVAAFVVLSVTDSDAAEFRGFLNIVANIGGLLLGGGAVAYSGAAARNSQVAAEQTNGQLDARIAAGVQRALDSQRAADTAPGGEFRRAE